MQLSPKNPVPETTRHTEAILEVLVMMDHVILFQVGVKRRKAIGAVIIVD